MLSLENLQKTYPPTGDGETPPPALVDLSLEIAQGEFFTLLGPSGCGKSTTLQCIAGLEHPTSGRITMDGRTVFCSDANIAVPPNRRGLGMVFQSYAIWPHLTVFENVAFPLRYGPGGTARGDVRARVLAALERVGLQDFADRPAPYLSGGQQQRVALARSLVNEPSIILLDEPLSNLDAKLRDSMRVELRDLVKSLGITTIYVTHDQTEALSMSDRIALLNKGRLVQLGTPDEIYKRPNSAFAAEFVGRSNILKGRLAERGADGIGLVDLSFGRVACPVPENQSVGAQVELMIRPHGVRAENGEAAAASRFRSTIRRISFVGEFLDMEAELGDETIRIFASPYSGFREGDAAWLEFPQDRCVLLAERA
ncbi:ABC transporter ATP-binding protein [Stappia indica]|uniref:ABC transporter ATP-binding protein n=1 Tax=Stappia indica TaxID=538381 RepID=UPI000834E813|nr:ABC transporter ATP-binding protein [Stappia indica]